MSGPVVEGGTVLFVDGEIAAVGRQVELPGDVETIDVTGRRVYPGLIAANSQLGLVEIDAVRASRDFAEVGQIKPNVRAEAAFNPDSELIPVTRADGITAALSVPLGGLIAGTSALMALDGWTWEDMRLKAPVGLHVFWPQMYIDHEPSAGRKPEEQKKARDAVLQKIRAAFAEARAYLKARRAEGEEGIPHHDVDLRWQAMRPVLDGEIPVFVHANGILQIQAAVDWAEEEGVRLVLVGAVDAWRAADLLVEKDIPVIVTGNLHWLPMRRWEAYNTVIANALKLYRAGVRFCIAGEGGSFQAPMERTLPFQAAVAAAHGLPKEEALKAVTLYAAQILGVDDRLGSIEVGKDATLIVTDGDPLEIRTRVERMFIRGRDVDLSSRHTQLYDKYRTKYRRMGLIAE